jgi:tetratricopeptide (TPR) repeat protein
MRLIAVFLFLSFSVYAQDTVKVATVAGLQLDQAYALGITALQNNRFPQADSVLTAIIDMQPLQDKAYALRAVARVKMGQNEAGLKDIAVAIQKNPTNAETWFNKSLIHLAAQQTDSQKVALDRCLAIKSDHAEAAYYKGVWHYNRGEYDKAIQFYTIATDARRDFTNAYNDRASCKRALNDLSGAIADYERALVTDSSSAVILNNLGSALRLNKSYEKAIAYYTMALRKDARYVPAYLNRGVTYQESGALDKAIADFERVITLDPKNAAAYNNLAAIAIKQNDYKKAKELADKSIERDARNGAAYYNRGIANQMLREDADCCSDWKKAAELGIESAKTLMYASCH